MFSVTDLINHDIGELKDTSIKVKAKKIKELFNDLEILFHKSVFSLTFKVELDNNKLYITASSSVHYMKIIDVEECGKITRFSHNYLFTDIFKLLPGSGVLTLILSTTFLSITGKGVKCVLSSSMSEVPEVKYDYEYEELNADVLAYVGNKIKSIASISKYYRKTPPINYKDSFMQVLYPPIYFQCKSSLLDVTMSATSNDMLTRLLISKGRGLMYNVNGNILTFTIGDTFMSTVKDSDSSYDDISELARNYRYITSVDLGSIANKVKVFQQSVGAGVVDVSVYGSTVKISKTLNGNIVSTIIGKSDTGTEKPSIQFQYMIELLVPILYFIDGSFEIRIKDNIMCLRSEDSYVLMSYVA